MKGLAAWLRMRKDIIVRRREVLEPQWDQTYGAGEPRETVIEEVDFDALMEAIEAFEQSFKKDRK